jgi:arylsulfatase A-like enzyme
VKQLFSTSTTSFQYHLPSWAPKLLLALAVLLVTGVRTLAAERPPNLVVILTDDQGYADVGFNGCQDIPTPNIDRLAAAGAKCTNGYVSYSICGPSRAGLITGRYQDRFGACNNPTINPAVPNNGVPLSEKNIAELLNPVGYRSMAVGKWHLGTHPDLRPLVRGFDEFYGFLAGGHQFFPHELTVPTLEDVDKYGDWYRTKLLRNETPVETDDYLTDELTDAGVDFIDRNHEKPFFLYMAYNAPHTPMQATKKYLDRFPHIQNKGRKTYAAMVSAVDDGVGRILEELAEHDLDENTIVFFLSDNGGATNNFSNNDPLRGRKGSPFEGGVRVPFAVRWSGTIPEGTSYELPVSALDIAATIVAHAGAEVSQEKPLDGVDLTPYLTGVNQESPHPVLFWRWHDRDGFAVRMGDHKLIHMGRQKREPIVEPSLLFDLGQDLGETQNLIQDRTEVVSKAQALLDAWEKQLIDPISPRLGSWFPNRGRPAGNKKKAATPGSAKKAG